MRPFQHKPGYTDRRVSPEELQADLINGASLANSPETKEDTGGVFDGYEDRIPILHRKTLPLPLSNNEFIGRTFGAGAILADLIAEAARDAAVASLED